MSTSILPVVQTQLTRYVMPIVLVIGNVGNIFIMILFSRYRKNACSLYLICAAVMNFLFIGYIIPMGVYGLTNGDPGGYSIIFCKLRQYLLHICSQLAKYLTILACIDRFILITYPARYSIINRPWVTRCIIGIMIIFWLILPIHLIIVPTINNGQCGLYGISYIAHQIYILIVTCLIPPISMTIFGCLVYRNMKRLHMRIQPVGNTINSNRSSIVIHRRDRDMLVMLLTEITVYVVIMFFYPFIVMEVAVTNYMGTSKSIEYLQIENFVFTIAVNLAYLNCATPFYTYLVASKAFRKNFKELLIKCKYRSVDGNITQTIQRAVHN